MQYNDIEIMRELCAEMGIVWDDTADSLKINNKPISDDFSFSSIFLESTGTASIPASNSLDFTINGFSSHNLKSVKIFDSSKYDMLAA